MKETIKKPLLISAAITVSGLAINLITYFLFGEIYLATQLYGGEWVGYQGFGIILNKVYPLSGPGEEAGISSWLSFDPISFIVPFVVLFFGILIIELMTKRQEKGYKGLFK